MPPLRPRTILVVDDAPDQRHTVARILTAGGYLVEEASTGREALDAVARNPALIVLDLHLPDISGLDVAEAIKSNSETASIPVLHLSATGLRSEEKARGVEHADAYLMQPVAPEVLLATVGALLRMRTRGESLRDSVQRLTSHLANVPAAITEWDENFRVKYWSPQAEKMFGWTAAEVCGKTPAEFDFVVAEDVPQVQRVHREMCAGQATRTRSFNRNRHKDGSILYCEWYNSSLSDGCGGHSNLGITLDVTTRVHYEQEISALNRELQRRVSELEAVLQAMPVGIAIAEDPECRHIRANPALSRLLGVPVTANVSMSVPDAERPRVRYFRDGQEVRASELPQQVVGRTGHEVRDVELELERPDGSRAVIFGNAAPLFDEQGHTRGSVAAWTDISERRRTEEQLRQSEQTLRLALRAAGMWSWELDLKAMTITWSEEARTRRGPGQQELTMPYPRWLAGVDPADQERVQQKLRAALRGEAEYDFEYRTASEDGEVIWIYNRGMLVRDAAGQPERMIGVGMDMTERKRTEEALRASEKLAATGKLAAALAHEINNPLAAVTNLLYLMDHDQGLSSVTRDYLAMAAAEIDRVAHITRSMLSFYRHPSKPAPMIISRTVEGVVNLHRPQLQVAGVQLDFRVQGEYPAVGYAPEVQQVISNLLLNAMESMPGGGRVLVEVRASRCWSGDGVPGTRIMIADNGPGIPAEHRHRLFEPFYSTKGGKGTGLGLWVCSNLAERNGGSLRFRTATGPERHGTCFCLFLPDATHRQHSLAALRQASGTD